MRAECFKCKRNFNTTNPEDEDGDFFCPKCQKGVDKIARTLDEEIAKKPKKEAPRKLEPFQRSADGHLEIYNARQLI